jgi:hypothetical protein
MDLLKALQRTTLLTTAAVFALGATEAGAADNVATLGHISASVQGTMAIAETSSMNFGNFTFGAGGAACSPCSGDATLVLSDSGLRTTPNAGTDHIVLLYGADAAPVGDVGQTGSNKETGAQRPGFFAITGATATTMYVSFADNTGAIIDSSYDPSTHPGNAVTMTGPVPGSFTVDKFTFETDTGAGGYTQAAPGVTDIYGTSVLLTGATATLRVGGTLHTVATKSPTVGHYTGTYYVMVSY